MWQKLIRSLKNLLKPLGRVLANSVQSRWADSALKPLRAISGWFRHYGLDVILGLAFVVVLGQVGLLSFNQLHLSHPVLGAKFDNYRVDEFGGDSLQRKIKDMLNIADQQAVVIKTSTYKAHVTARQLGAIHDNREVQKKLLKLGRQGGFWQRLIDQDAAIFGRRNFKDSFSTINKQLVSIYLQKVNTQVQIAPLNASFVYQNQQLVIQPEQSGSEINIEQAFKALQSVDLNKPIDELNLPLSHPSATVTQQELQPLLPQAQQVVAGPLTIVAGSQQVHLEPEQLTALLQAEKIPDPVNPYKQIVSLTYNDSKLSAVLDRLASQVVVPAQPKVVSGQKIISVGTPGVQLDGTHAKVEVIAELERRQLRSTLSPTAPPVTAPTPTAKPQPSPVPATPNPGTPTNPEAGDSVVVPVEKIDPPVINQVATTNPLGRYPALLNGKSMIYLTIDDGPGAYTEQLLDILKRYNVHAIFFLIGKNSLVYPQTVKRIQAEGHTIGNHSYTHSNLATMSEAAVTNELVKTQNVIRDITGVKPDLFRPPYGSLGANVYSSTAKNNLSIMMWSIDPRDWSQPGVSIIVQRVVNAATPGGNILLHSNHQQTVDALPSIIETLRTKGYTLP